MANSLDDSYEEPDFLELYSFHTDKKIGLVLIDPSKGCYPLIFYPNDDNPQHGNRIWGFQQILPDLLLSHSKYDDLLRKSPEWNDILVDELRATFTFPEKNPNSG